MRSWEWARFACGVWVFGEDTAIDDAEWSRCANKDVRIPKGSEGVFVGIDVGLKRDTTAIVPVWHDGEKIRVHPPTILIPPDEGLAFKPIIQAVKDLSELWPGMTVLIDPNAGGEFIANALENDLGLDVVVFSQQPAPMAIAAQRLTSAIVDGTLEHPDDAELNRHVLSATAKTVGEGWRFAKSSKRSVPNDGVIALAMAVSQITAPSDGPSVYEEKELLVL
jgi:phage terminase large subunit-like protein